MQTLTPSASRHQATSEFIHDHHFALLHHVVLIPVVKVVGTQGRVQMVHQGDIGWIVERCALWNQAQLKENFFGAFMALLG